VADPIPSDVDTLRAALAAEQQARRDAEARASGAEAMVAHLKLLIAKMRRDRFGASAERGRKLLDQLEMQLEELETAATEDEVAADTAPVVQIKAILAQRIACLSEVRSKPIRLLPQMAGRSANPLLILAADPLLTLAISFASFVLFGYLLVLFTVPEYSRMYPNDSFPEVFDPLIENLTWFWEPTAKEYTEYIPILCSTLLTTVWTILFFVSTTLLKILLPLQRFTAWFFDVEKRPLQAVGVVSGALVMIGTGFWSLIRTVI
jgi:Transposase C of IS166 homeodomain